MPHRQVDGLGTAGDAQLAERLAVASAVVAALRAVTLAAALALPAGAAAQTPEPCHFVCGLEWKFEPTFLDDASRWSLSFVIIIPIAPL